MNGENEDNIEELIDTEKHEQFESYEPLSDELDDENPPTEDLGSE